MTTILALIFILFLSLIVYLVNKMQSDRIRFNARIKFLEDFIVQISNEQKAKDSQLQLSDELKVRMDQVNEALSKDIYDMNFKLVEELYPRK